MDTSSAGSLLSSAILRPVSCRLLRLTVFHYLLRVYHVAGRDPFWREGRCAGRARFFTLGASGKAPADVDAMCRRVVEHVHRDVGPPCTLLVRAYFVTHSGGVACVYCTVDGEAACIAKTARMAHQRQQSQHWQIGRRQGLVTVTVAGHWREVRHPPFARVAVSQAVDQCVSYTRAPQSRGSGAT